MKMFMLGLCAMYSLVVCGQNATLAQSVMDSCVNRVKSLSAYEAKIVYSSEHLSGEAHIFYDHGKYRLMMGNVVRICDGEYLYTIMEDIKEVNVENILSHSGALGSISDILNIFVRNFKPYMVYDKGSRYVLVLEPMSQERELACVEIELDKKTYMPFYVVEKMNVGQGSTIKIDALNTKPQVEESVYMFDAEKYNREGYYIIRP